MTDIDLSATIEYYRTKLNEHGPGARGMDWKDGDTQLLRFEVISRYIDWKTRPSVLDVGCGSGEFLGFCQERGFDVDYLGIDICPEMVAACQERFGKESARLGSVTSNGDSDLTEASTRFDYVIASGTFNAKLDETDDRWREYFHANVVAMYEKCTVAMIVNMMTCFVDYTYDRLYYPTPQEMTALAVERMSRDFVLNHSYPLYEMTLAVFRPAEATDGG